MELVVAGQLEQETVHLAAQRDRDPERYATPAHDVAEQLGLRDLLTDDACVGVARVAVLEPHLGAWERYSRIPAVVAYPHGACGLREASPGASAASGPPRSTSDARRPVCRLANSGDASSCHR